MPAHSAEADANQPFDHRHDDDDVRSTESNSNKNLREQRQQHDVFGPVSTFNYDETSALGVSGLLNTDGRTSSSLVAGSQAGGVFSYDKLGGVKTNSQCTPQNCGTPSVFPINYTYDLLGDTLTATNGVGVTLTYPPYNRALRIMGMTSSLSDANHPGTLLSSPHYNAAGSALSESIGNTSSSVNESRSYDGRLRLTNISDGSIYSVTIPTTGGYAPDCSTCRQVVMALLKASRLVTKNAFIPPPFARA